MNTWDGDSASTRQAQDSARKCFNANASFNGMESLMQTSRATFRTETFFQKFAYYLTNTYKTKNETLLMNGKVLKLSIVFYL